MKHDFDSALSALLWIVEGHAPASTLRQVCVVRDLRGRLRLVVEPADSSPFEPAPLQRELDTELEGWFAGSILLTSASARPDESRLAREILKQAQPWPSDWPQEGAPPIGIGKSIDTGRYRAIQRSISKESWLTADPGTPPWPLIEHAPRIVSFHSFKGGVGRSTALGIVAWQLSREGKKVVCIDLDLESPGLAKMLGARDEPGVLDFLLTRMATEKAPDSGFIQSVKVRNKDLLVVPAGSLGPSYLEKLARLDFMGRVDVARKRSTSMVEEALRDLLKVVRSKHDPDFILLDCRAGLSDIGGLGLNDLPHVEVLVGRTGSQWLAGLNITLGVLGRRHKTAERRVIVLQTFVSPEPATRKAQEEKHLSEVYDLFLKHFYQEDEDTTGREDEATSKIAAREDETASHYPTVVLNYTELATADRLEEVDESILGNEAFSNLRRRIQEKGEPESVASAEERET